MNTFLILFLILFFAFLILFIFNDILSKKYYENYNSSTDFALICGNENDSCKIDEEGDSTCCSGYTCTRNEGNFHNKVCKSDDEVNFNFSTNFGNLFGNLSTEITYPTIKRPSINIPSIDSIGSRIPNVDFPNINLNYDVKLPNINGSSGTGFNFDFMNFDKWGDSLNCNTIK
jgi:hypothetical protein